MLPALYSIIFAFVFFIIPFMYFYYEERDSDLFNSNRALSALKFTLVFVILAAFFLLIGYLLAFKANVFYLYKKTNCVFK